MDAYSKIVQTIIALALVWLCVRPVLMSKAADAQSITDVRIVAFDLNSPLPVTSSSPLPVSIVRAASPIPVSLTGPFPIPVHTR